MHFAFIQESLPRIVQRIVNPRRLKGLACIRFSKQATNTEDTECKQACDQTKPMKRTQRDHSQKRVVIAEWRKRSNIWMHETVENDVRVAASRSAKHDRSQTELSPLERVWQLEPGSKPMRHDEDCERCYHDQGRAEVGVEEPVEWVLMSNHKVQWLDIDENVRATKGEKAELLGHKCMNCRAGPEVKGGDGHG